VPEWSRPGRDFARNTALTDIEALSLTFGSLHAGRADEKIVSRISIEASNVFRRT
jgi:hypothetical protein